MAFFFVTASKKISEFLVFWLKKEPHISQILLKLWLIGNRTSRRPIRSVIILVIKQIGLPLRGRPILLITGMITDRIGLHSVLLPLLSTLRSKNQGSYMQVLTLLNKKEKYSEAFLSMQAISVPDVDILRLYHSHWMQFSKGSFYMNLLFGWVTCSK